MRYTEWFRRKGNGTPAQISIAQKMLGGEAQRAKYAGLFQSTVRGVGPDGTLYEAGVVGAQPYVNVQSAPQNEGPLVQVVVNVLTGLRVGTFVLSPDPHPVSDTFTLSYAGDILQSAGESFTGWNPPLQGVQAYARSGYDILSRARQAGYISAVTGDPVASIMAPFYSSTQIIGVIFDAPSATYFAIYGALQYGGSAYAANPPSYYAPIVPMSARVAPLLSMAAQMRAAFLAQGASADSPALSRLEGYAFRCCTAAPMQTLSVSGLSSVPDAPALINIASFARNAPVAIGVFAGTVCQYTFSVAAGVVTATAQLVIDNGLVPYFYDSSPNLPTSYSLTEYSRYKYYGPACQPYRASVFPAYPNNFCPVPGDASSLPAYANAPFYAYFDINDKLVTVEYTYAPGTVAASVTGTSDYTEAQCAAQALQAGVGSAAGVLVANYTAAAITNEYGSGVVTELFPSRPNFYTATYNGYPLEAGISTTGTYVGGAAPIVFDPVAQSCASPQAKSYVSNVYRVFISTTLGVSTGANAGALGSVFSSAFATFSYATPLAQSAGYNTTLSESGSALAFITQSIFPFEYSMPKYIYAGAMPNYGNSALYQYADPANAPFYYTSFLFPGCDVFPASIPYVSGTLAPATNWFPNAPLIGTFVAAQTPQALTCQDQNVSIISDPIINASGAPLGQAAWIRSAGFNYTPQDGYPSLNTSVLGAACGDYLPTAVSVAVPSGGSIVKGEGAVGQTYNISVSGTGPTVVSGQTQLIARSGMLNADGRYVMAYGDSTTSVVIIDDTTVVPIIITCVAKIANLMAVSIPYSPVPPLYGPLSSGAEGYVSPANGFAMPFANAFFMFSVLSQPTCTNCTPASSPSFTSDTWYGFGTPNAGFLGVGETLAPHTITNYIAPGAAVPPASTAPAVASSASYVVSWNCCLGSSTPIMVASATGTLAYGDPTAVNANMPSGTGLAVPQTYANALAPLGTLASYNHFVYGMQYDTSAPVGVFNDLILSDAPSVIAFMQAPRTGLTSQGANGAYVVVNSYANSGPTAAPSTPYYSSPEYTSGVAGIINVPFDQYFFVGWA